MAPCIDFDIACTWGSRPPFGVIRLNSGPSGRGSVVPLKFVPQKVVAALDFATQAICIWCDCCASQAGLLWRNMCITPLHAKGLRVFVMI